MTCKKEDYNGGLAIVGLMVIIIGIVHLIYSIDLFRMISIPIILLGIFCLLLEKYGPKDHEIGK